MLVLSPISDTAEKVFLDCIENMDDTQLKAELISIRNEVVRQDSDYHIAGPKSEFYKLKPHATVGNTITAADMKWVYENRLVKSVAGRVYYDKIMALPRFSTCPLCAHGTVLSLDHYLPKAEFPGLAVSPRNLLPSCFDCNKAKLDSIPTCHSKQTLNPYYDDLQDDVWLEAQFKQQLPVVVTFHVSKPSSWDDLKVRRVRHHLTAFQLNRRYALQAASELQGIKQYLTDLLATGGYSEVQTYLVEMADSRAALNKNSWQAALYRALAKSGWFCKVGCKG